MTIETTCIHCMRVNKTKGEKSKNEYYEEWQQSKL
jgi:hypothetical protein